MIITVEEMKNYLRVDSADDDALITGMIEASEKHCMDVLRTDDASVLESCENGKIAVMFMTAYLYEHCFSVTGRWDSDGCCCFKRKGDVSGQ